MGGLPWSGDQWAQPLVTDLGQQASKKFPFIMPRARAFDTSVCFTSGPSNPCDDCVATRDWMALLLLGSKGVITLLFSPETCTHKILQGHVEFGDLLAK